MHHTTGRHRRRHRTLVGRLRATVAASLAAALAFVLVPDPPRREPVLIPPPPEPPRPPEPLAAEYDTEYSDAGDPDEIGGALVRPYMSRSLPPPPRLPGDDLLAAPTRQPPDDLGELAAVVRTYLGTLG